MDGYIQVHRKTMESFVFGNEKMFKIWMWCLFKASYNERDIYIGMQKIHLLPGQFVFGRDSAAEQLHINRSTVYKCIKLLKKEGNIKTESDNKKTIITLTKWAEYQLSAVTTDKKQNVEKSNNEKTAVKADLPPVSDFEILESSNKVATKAQQSSTNNNTNNTNNTNNFNKDFKIDKSILSADEISEFKNTNLEIDSDLDHSPLFFADTTSANTGSLAIEKGTAANKEFTTSSIDQPNNTKPLKKQRKQANITAKQITDDPNELTTKKIAFIIAKKIEEICGSQVPADFAATATAIKRMRENGYDLLNALKTVENAEKLVEKISKIEWFGKNRAITAYSFLNSTVITTAMNEIKEDAKCVNTGFDDNDEIFKDGHYKHLQQYIPDELKALI